MRPVRKSVFHRRLLTTVSAVSERILTLLKELETDDLKRTRTL